MVLKATAFKKLRNPQGYDLSASWQSALVTLVLLLVIGFFAMKSIQDSPAKAIRIHSVNLTNSEAQMLQSVTDQFGEVQFFEADLQKIHDDVMAMTWVEYAKVSRDWYQGILVEIVPRKAIANFGSQHLIDANGVVFSPANTKELMNPNLVTLYGTPEDAEKIMQKMQYINGLFVPLGMTAKDVILTPRKTWIVRFDNGLRVVVDHEDTNKKLYDLSAVLKERFSHDVHKMQSVDLRYKNGFSIAWKQGK